MVSGRCGAESFQDIPVQVSQIFVDPAMLYLFDDKMLDSGQIADINSVTNRRAQVPVFDEECKIVLEDGARNRYTNSITYRCGRARYSVPTRKPLYTFPEAP